MEDDDEDRLDLEREPGSEDSSSSSSNNNNNNRSTSNGDYGNNINDGQQVIVSDVHPSKGSNNNSSNNSNNSSHEWRSTSSASRRGIRSSSGGLRLRIPLSTMTVSDRAFVSVSPAPLSSTSSSLMSRSGKRRRSSWETRPTSALVRKLDLEKSNDGGGGFSIRGFFVTTGCYVGMFIMSTFFFVAGAVMLAVSYGDVDEEEMEETNTSAKKHEDKTNYARVVGPVLMSLAIIVFVLALCLCLLAVKASQAEREENYFAKSNSRISTITSPTELRSSEVFTPAISAMLPLSLMATPTIPVVLERSDLGRLINLVSFQEQQQQYQRFFTTSDLETSPGGDPMHAVAPVHGRPRRNSLPGSLTQQQGPSPQEEFRIPHYQRRSTRRASIISEARQELKTSFRSNSAGDERRRRIMSRTPSPSAMPLPPPPPQSQLSARSTSMRRMPTLPRDTAVSRRDVACFPTTTEPLTLEVCQEATLPHIVVSDQPSAPSSLQHSANTADKKVKFMLEEEQQEGDDDGRISRRSKHGAL